MVNTVGLHTGAAFPKSALNSPLRIMTYHANPYEEFKATVATIVHVSDSVTAATPTMTQKPTRVNPARIKRTTMMPSGISGRLSIKEAPITTSDSQGTINIANVDKIFAVVY